MGHAYHGLLSLTTYSHFWGTKTTRDFVEGKPESSHLAVEPGSAAIQLSSADTLNSAFSDARELDIFQACSADDHVALQDWRKYSR